MTGPLLVPVGHFQGTLHGEQTTHTVRLGTRTLQLDEADAAAWLLAHGTEESGSRLFSRDELAAPPDVVTRLYARGLLAELPAAADEYAGFLANYRLEPLVHGLGNGSGGDAGRYGIGLPGTTLGRTTGLSGPWTRLSPVAYHLWRWSAVDRSLAEVCARLPVADRAAPYRLDAARAAEQAVALVASGVTGWTAALQPAAPARLVGGEAPRLPVVEPSAGPDPEDLVDVPYAPGQPGSPTLRVPRWELDPGHPGAAGWLFAAGHGGGPSYRLTDLSFEGHFVRIGRTDHPLTEGEGRLWEITRGADAGRLWNRTAVAAAAVGDGVADAGRLLDGLLDRGVLLEVHPGTPQAVAFARAYRLLPLLHGLGDRPHDRRIFRYGVPGRRVAGSSVETALLWRTAGRSLTLWDALVELTGSTGTERFLTERGFAAIRRLLRDGLICLDVAP